MEPKYPDITVTLTGTDGNAFSILGKVCGALRQHGLSKSEIGQFVREATSNDYEHLLQVCTEWVDVE